ncbi:hypothetical protein OROGR_026141 [Orobanche gracilis]
MTMKTSISCCLLVRIDYEELMEATQGFNTLIGVGRFGTMYKGTLSEGIEVVVKNITCLGTQGKREFLSDIAVIEKIHHVNFDDLVLEWKERCEIALEAARGLAYLHPGCENKIIHCEVKPVNILLHDKLQIKISNFGLSNLLGTEQLAQSTTMRGTHGYLAPEWLMSSAISENTDVYSYGMVCLEITRGKMNSLPQHL